MRSDHTTHINSGRDMAKYIEFQKMPRIKGRTTDRWSVVNKKHSIILGRIEWYSPWRQYIFTCLPDCVFSAGCFQDICEFIGEQKAEHDAMILRRKISAIDANINSG